MNASNVAFVVFIPTETKVLDLGAHENDGFRAACKKGHLEVVKFLVSDPRVDIAARYHEGFRNACEMGHLEVVKFLCPHICETTIFGHTGVLTKLGLFRWICLDRHACIKTVKYSAKQKRS